jgi:tRNA A-37 threonylcarbamoyl transferase component Bud32
MTDAPEPRAGEPPGEYIDRVCDHFEGGWLAGRPGPLEDLVRAAPAPVRPALFRDLLAVEREYRAQAGRPVTAAEGRDRFAGLGPWAAAVVAAALADTASWVGRDTRPDELPRAVGKYRVVRLLGRGGMGSVYAAEHPDLRRTVAVKVMRPELAARADARERFLREARAAARVEHENVVAIHDVDQDGDAPFIVMPHLRGESLEARLGRGPMPVGLAVRVGREVALGLQAAHAAGLIHRDVKPANVWLEGDPAAADPAGQVRRAKVLDFGLARAADGADGLTASGWVAGTAAYMSPEQADGAELDGRSDLFSLGAVLYRLLAGRPAFAGPTLTAILRAVAAHDPPPPDAVNPEVSPALSGLVKRLLSKDPAGRPASAAAVADELVRIEAGLADAGSSAGPAPAAGRRRRWAWVAAAALVLAAAGVGLWLATRPGGPPAPGTPGGTPAAPAPPPAGTAGPARCRGSVDLLVIRHDVDGAEVAVPLSDPRAMPVRTGDHVKVVAAVEPPAYLYLVWIDEAGQAIPVHPWRLGEWGSRPAAEAPVPRLEVKGPDGRWLKITGAAAGMETVLMLARPAPLGVPDAEVRGWFAGLRPLPLPVPTAGEPSRGWHARAWFEGFDLVRDDPLRRGVGFDEGPAGADTPLGQQAVLRGRIGAEAGYSRAVSFARLGGNQ